MIKVFSKEWFHKHQKVIRWFANTFIGRYVLRIHGKRSSVGKNKIVLIEPHSITWVTGKMDGTYELKTEFRTKAKFARRLFYTFRPLWYLIHGWDMIVNQVKPSWNLGFDTLTAYPDVEAGTTTDDRRVFRVPGGDGETFAVIVAGAGTGESGTNYARLSASTVSDQYSTLQRVIMTFDTSSIAAEATVSAATLSINGRTDAASGLGTPDLDIVDASPADDSNIASTDFSNIGTTVYGSVAYGSINFGGSTYTEITLDTASVNKGSITRFGGRISWDTDGVFGGTWSSGANTQIAFDDADAAGTDKDPKLVVTYSVGGAGYINIPILGAG